MFEITACRRHVDVSHDQNGSYLTYLLKPHLLFELEIDGIQYSQQDFAVSFDDQQKPVKLVANIYDNNFMGRNLRSENLLDEEALGRITLLNFPNSIQKSLHYQIYLHSEVFKTIVAECFQKMPQELTLNCENADGTWFNNEWLRGEDKRYPIPRITEFNHYIDLK